MTVDVVNWNPEVTLTAPTQGATLYSDQAVPLRANVADRDFEAFNVACPVAPGEACIEWTSDIDGRLDLIDTESVPWNNFARLSQGAHTLTVTVRDGRGASASASVDVLVQAGQGKPSALILTRNNAAPGPMGYELRGRGIDPEDGTLRGASLSWYSSRDGFLGTGSRVFADLSTPARSGTLFHHVITLIVRDSDGNEGTDEIGIDVWRID